MPAQVDASTLTLERAMPPNRRRQLALSFPVSWRHRRVHRLPQPGELGGYYITWSAGTGTFGEDWEVLPRDPEGVIRSRGNECYFPIGIAQYALHLYDRAREERDDAALEMFLKHARWLRDSQQTMRGIAGCYPVAFPWPKYGASVNWLSAMAQGEAISALLRAESVAPGAGFMEAAVEAAQPFRFPIRTGGVVWRGHSGAFLEEVAVDPAAHILNGCIFALWGLYDLQKVAPAPWICDLIAEAGATLERRLPDFDLGWWSAYSLLRTRDGRPHLAPLKYHAFHISQLRVLSVMLASRSFESTADRWESYIGALGSRVRVLAATARNLAGRVVAHDDEVAGGSSSIPGG